MKDVSTLVRLVISTLNDVEVKGKSNLDNLLGSINALESVAQILETLLPPPATTEEEKKEESNG